MVLKEDPQTRVRAAGRLIMRSTSKEDSVLRRPSLAAMMLAGGAFLIASGTIHLRLWYQAYRHIPTIGPLFLVPGIAGILLAMGMVGYRRLGTAVAGAGYMAASIGGLLVSTKVGLFGFHDSLLAPYARLSLNLEIAGLIVLAGAALLLVAPTFDNVLKSVSSGRSRRSVVQTQRYGVAAGHGGCGYVRGLPPSRADRRAWTQDHMGGRLDELEVHYGPAVTKPTLA